jgi:lipoprotein-releasing system permease protein
MILRIFLIQGGLVGFLGSLGGALLGVGLSRLFAAMQTNPDGSPMFPATVDPPLFLGAIVLATLVGLLAAVTPARRAARLDPAQVIRYG